MSEYKGPPLPTFDEETRSEYWGGFYQVGVENMTPTQKKPFRGRILPAYDWTLSMNDTEFARAYAPYRQTDVVDSETGQPHISAFFLRAMAYTWFGKGRVRFLSPETRKYMVGDYDRIDFADPIKDIRSVIYASGDPVLKALTKRPDGKDGNAVVPYPQTRCLFNMWGNEISERTPRNIIIDVSATAVEDLIDKLNEWRPAHESIIDPEWDMYLFGDITKPATGLMVDVVPIPATPQPFNGFVLTNGTHKSLKGTEQVPVPDHALEGRYNFWTENALKIYEYQEIVDYLLDDGEIPRELIAKACSEKANVGKAASNTATTFPAPANTEVKPAPVEEKPAAPTPPQQEEVTYWISDNGEVFKGDSAKIMQMLRSGNSDFMVMPVGKQPAVWEAPYSLGFSAPEPEPVQEEAPPPPPARAEEPPAPAPAQGPPPATFQPQQPVKESVAVDPSGANATKEEGSPLTADEKSRLNTLQKKLEDEQLDAQELMEYVKLSSRPAASAT